MCVHQPLMNIRVDFKQADASIRILSHGEPGRYWINLLTSKDIRPVGVEVTMYVALDQCVGRHRYLRRVTLDTLLEHGQSLYGDSEEEKELLDDCVDMTYVSGVC